MVYVDLTVEVNRSVPESHHRLDPIDKLCRYYPADESTSKTSAWLLGEPRAFPGDDVASRVDHCLNRRLQQSNSRMKGIDPSENPSRGISASLRSISRFLE